MMILANKMKNILKTNNFVNIKNGPDYYNNIYNYLLSKKLIPMIKGKPTGKKYNIQYYMIKKQKKLQNIKRDKIID